MVPLVSILIPAYNAERWIADTIRSALGQTWPRKEIIVVDDGSTDKTLAVAQQFASNSISVVNQVNKGAAAARNKAFALSNGDYIQWLDADDLLDPDKVEKQAEAAESCASKRTLFSSPWGHFYTRPQRARFVPTGLWCDLSPAEYLLRKMETDHFLTNSSWLVSRELTEAAGPWDDRLLVDDDGEYFCRVVRASDGIRFVPEARTYYRRSFNSLSYIGNSASKLEAQLLSNELHIKYLLSMEDSPRSRAACLNCLQSFLPLVYPEHMDLVRRTQELAASLGGRLEPPRLPWKYSWIQRAVGWTAAKRAQMRYNVLKSSFLGTFDRALLRLGF